MAKVVATMDTSDNSYSVTLDGNEIADVMYFTAAKYKDYDGNEKCHFMVESRRDSDNKDYHTSTYIMSKASKEGQEAIKAGLAIESPAYPDLVLVKKSTNPQDDAWFKKISSFVNG